MKSEKSKAEIIRSVHDRESLYRAVKTLVSRSRYGYMSHIEHAMGHSSRSYVRTVIYTCTPERILKLMYGLSGYIGLSLKECNEMCKAIKPIKYYHLRGHYVAKNRLHHITKGRMEAYYRLYWLAKLNNRQGLKKEIAKLKHKIKDRKTFWLYIRGLIIAHHMTVSGVSNRVYGNKSYLYEVILTEYRSVVVRCCRKLAKVFKFDPEILLEPLKNAHIPDDDWNVETVRRAGKSLKITLPKGLGIKNGDTYRITKKPNGTLMFKPSKRRD